MKIYENIVRTG